MLAFNQGLQGWHGGHCRWPLEQGLHARMWFQIEAGFARSAGPGRGVEVGYAAFETVHYSGSFRNNGPLSHKETLAAKLPLAQTEMTDHVPPQLSIGLVRTWDVPTALPCRSGGLGPAIERLSRLMWGLTFPPSDPPSEQPAPLAATPARLPRPESSCG